MSITFLAMLGMGISLSGIGLGMRKSGGKWKAFFYGGLLEILLSLVQFFVADP